MLSASMTDKVMSEEHVGTRITWVRIKDRVCNMFFIVVYIPRNGRQQKLMTQDTITQLKSLPKLPFEWVLEDEEDHMFCFFVCLQCTL